ncbi:MAG: addiction module antitoxin [Hyphomicrobium sp. SCN 65-11]|nr:MAG: addiction module antitoxin [Hyphomicrobium sp. SCN 65-11]
MAARIERAFGIPASHLLEMQAAFDGQGSVAPSSAKSYVPPFLALRADHIEQWASRSIPARIRLAVFLRTLVNSTGAGLERVDFPGNDEAERAGWDGFVEAGEGTPWIPEGKSGWEFGTNKGVKAKADGDFAKSSKGTPKAERTQTTFVFVTPRRWAGKSAWAAQAKSKGGWKDVRAYDAQDLEQWLEQSLAGQAWLANEIGHPSEGVRSLDQCWFDWAHVSDPPLPGKLFSSAIDAATRTMTARIESQAIEPTVITADSVEEALAFLSQLFSESGGKKLAALRDQVLIFGLPGVLPRLAQTTQTFIAVISSREVEREFVPLASSIRTIVVYPRNATTAETHVVLEPIGSVLFRTTLEEQGFDQDRVARLSDESGRSLTVLRRRLAPAGSTLRTPEWAADSLTAQSLVPFLLVGTWDSSNSADLTALSLLAGGPSAEDLEKRVQQYAGLNDAPLWSVGEFRGAISKLDLLFAIAPKITAAELRRYFELARIVLGEDDPTLDLPESDRWMSSIKGKTREFSAAFRKAIAETLVLLAVHGDALFRSRLGFNAAIEAEKLVHDVLNPLTTRKLEANNHDLPTYAEAAPSTFLAMIERDLRSSEPAILGLLRPASTGVLGGSPARTGLLWALEGLAWAPDTMPRVARILSRLAQVEISDNWANKPINSLKAIFSSWMPQTAADQAQRLSALNLIVREYPDIAWKICISEINTGARSGTYSHKQNWRADGYGFGQPLPTWGPILEFIHELIELVLAWPGHTRGMLCDLIDSVGYMDAASQKRVWGLVDAFRKERATDEDKAELREKVRVTVLSRRAARHLHPSNRRQLTRLARKAYAALEPSDVMNRHAWLFLETTVEESADEREDAELDFRGREARISALRVAALREVIAARGTAGVIEMARRGNAAWVVGWLLARELTSLIDAPSFIVSAFRARPVSDSWSERSLIVGMLRAISSDEERTNLLKDVASELSPSDFVQVLRMAPFRRSTWAMVDALDPGQRHVYWAEVGPEWIHEANDEASEAVERLLQADRPRAAFSVVSYDPSMIEPRALYRLLNEIAATGRDEAQQYRLDRHSLEKAITHIGHCSDLSLEEKARLEFSYLPVLSARWGGNERPGIPNLETFIERNPDLYIQAVVWAFRRNDAGVDPDEVRAPDDRIRELAERGNDLIDAIRRLPGRDEHGNLTAEGLGRWVKRVREACAQLARAEVADLCLGKLFAKAPYGEDGVWPCEPLREVIEDLQSEDMARGICNGIYNARGVYYRGEGGAQEREIAEKYRVWSNALQFSHPFVAARVLGQVVRRYEAEASREDTEAGVRRRMFT